MTTTSIIIPTYNRETELQVALKSILRQSRLPDEVILCDDGHLSDFPLRKEFEKKGIDCIFHKKKIPGLTESRNEGIDRSHGDIILFLDDDIQLFPEYVASVISVFEDDPEQRIGGVGGAVINPKPMNAARRARWMFNLLFLNDGLREGKVLPSGYCTDFGTTPFPLKHQCRVDFLVGCCFSFRRKIFDTYRFTPRYRSYALGEDKDFSYRVSADFDLMYCPTARLYHFESPAMRPHKDIMTQKNIMSRYLFFRDYVCRRKWQWLLYGYSLAGYILAQSLVALFSRDQDQKKRINGAFAALKRILRGDVPA